MSFTSGTYFVFLIAVFFTYWLIAGRYKLRVAFLVLAGALFYTQAGARPLLLLLAVSLIDFTTTKLMSHGRDQSVRKLLLGVSLLADIGTLCVFKYANFFIDSATSAFSLSGLKVNIPHPSLIAPLGISFFIFQSVAYVVDVYRRDTEPAQSYGEYLAFISFFPTIVAGPILRAKQLLPQFRGGLALDAEAGGQALFLIALGLVKKIAIADYLAANFVDRVFDFPDRFSALEAWAAFYGYALQIYADFSGYSDIAIGSAMLLGFTLPANFNAPYRSQNLPEFWRRWHISLSSWLRDYVFFSIAGRRRRAAWLYAGLIITMLVGGLWHGPTWTFVLWGLLHGLGLAAVRLFEEFRKRRGIVRINTQWSQAASVFLTFHFICFTWVFFRAESFWQATGLLRQMFSFTADTSNLARPVALIIVFGLLSHWIPDRAWETTRNGFVRLPAPVQAAALLGLAIGLYFVTSTDVVPFIYARF
ncbi:MAG TPA: MBOAT family O-acyltransferase [Blastocatellia bacterium]|nr:MBOAT family O-acyltransferase [Blastocatellia bacterium]